MKLAHAVRVAEAFVKANKLSSEERIAFTVLIQLGHRVHAAKPSFRAVAKALEGAELNQSEMFAKADDDG